MTTIMRKTLKERQAAEINSKPLCNFMETRSDFCEISGDIRVQGNSSTVVVASLEKRNWTSKGWWTIRPYARKGNADAMKLVKSWSIAREKFPHCSIKHSVAAILFSLGGFSGNHFHDFTDLLIPLYLTSTQFKGEVQFLVTDNRPWWIIKFKRILEKMSRYEIIDMDREEKIHCYSHMIVGLKSHKELSIDPSKSPAGLSMTDFRHLLRKTYSLKRHTVAGLKQKKDKRRRLMIISRRSSRALTNERRISKMAKSIGYEVVVAEASLATDLSRFAQLVNSCDVLMGVHGAGLTNMVFLPDNAIVIQILPLGEIDGLARDDFKEPAKGMNLRYLEYKIKRKESSLAKLYSPDNAILTDPFICPQGWMGCS